MTRTQIRPGIGIYSRADAARLLRLTPSRLSRWVTGYTYWLPDTAHGRAKRRQPPVINADLPLIDSVVALSFLELMELRVVKAITEQGVSLQHVRAAARLAGRRFDTAHPFASRRVFTDGRAIFSTVSEGGSTADVVKWKPDEIDQVVAGGIFEQFLQEIEFDQKTSLAHRWWPLGRTEPIVLDPQVSFGAPVIEGTAVRTSTIARMVHHRGLEDAAVAYELELRQAEAAAAFEALLIAA